MSCIYLHCSICVVTFYFYIYLPIDFKRPIFIIYLLKKLFLVGCVRSLLWHAGASIFIVACGIFSCSMQTLSCGMWDLVP